MPSFNNTPDDWQRLDWQILRDGGIQLYWRREYLVEDVQWFAKHDYEVFEFACDTWKSQDDMFSDFARVLRLPDYFGRNLDALDDCITDLPLTGNHGALIVLKRFDAYAAGAGSTPMNRLSTEAEVVLDIIASASRFYLLNGNRLVALVQTNDPQLRFGLLGGKMPQWNHREWLNENRQPNPA
jgi:Barstar (barnase inhibitor)